MTTTSPTNGPQIQDWKVRAAITDLTTGLNVVEAAVSNVALLASTAAGVTQAITFSFAAGGYGTDTLSLCADLKIMLAKFKTAKLMAV